MWGLINSLQIIAHIPLIEVVLPANSKLVYDLSQRIANFDNPVTEHAKGLVLEKLQRFFEIKSKEEQAEGVEQLKELDTAEKRRLATSDDYNGSSLS